MASFDLAGTIKVLKDLTSYPVFKTDITKDESRENESFFIIEPDGNLTNAGNHYEKECLISFVTKKDKIIDEIALILAVEPNGLIFQRTETDFGRMADTQQEVKMLTFYFTAPLVVEY